MEDLAPKEESQVLSWGNALCAIRDSRGLSAIRVIIKRAIERYKENAVTHGYEVLWLRGAVGSLRELEDQIELVMNRWDRFEKEKEDGKKQE